MGLLNRIVNKKTILLGGLAIAAAAGAMKNKDRVAGLIGVRSSSPEPPYPTAAPSPPAAPSNYDAAGPPANTATRVPAPEPVVRPGGVDEQAEEQAAAAEAAAIGGAAPEYAGRTLDEPAEESFRPLAESGEGEAEGQEQAEADLRDNAEPSAGDPIDAERQIEEVIEQTGRPTAGETVEAVVPGGEERPTEDIASTMDQERDEGAAASTASTFDTSAEPEAPTEQPAREDGDDGGGSEWQTWSGRAVDR